MTPLEEHLRRLLEEVKSSGLTIEQGLEELRNLAFEDLGFAKVDHHRELRKGFPEVIFGEGKEPDQLRAIARSIIKKRRPLLVTRVPTELLPSLKRLSRRAESNPVAGTLFVPAPGRQPTPIGNILVVCAGTSDLPVAKEAEVTCKAMGQRVSLLCDVGVAGLHRLLSAADQIRAARVIIVVAGMEGALPSVVSGLCDVPVIAVPTSVGYGASFQGVAALLGMLSSCAPGLTVVNIDNGFGAAYAAALINRGPR